MDESEKGEILFLKASSFSESDAILTIDAKLGYRNSNETKWKLLAKSIEERRLSCDPPEVGRAAIINIFYNKYYLEALVIAVN